MADKITTLCINMAWRSDYVFDMYRSPWNLNEGKAWVNDARIMKRKPRAPLQK